MVSTGIILGAVFISIGILVVAITYFLMGRNYERHGVPGACVRSRDKRHRRQRQDRDVELGRFASGSDAGKGEPARSTIAHHRH
jgi:hypothetical protein